MRTGRSTACAGPRTADACGLGREKVAGDAAILIHRHRRRPLQTSTRLAFMPHWQSVERGHWQAACRLAGLEFIDPRRPVEDVLVAIESSSALVTEAMHGAIVADSLRVPWIPARPLHASHRSKWLDWAEALHLDLSPHNLWPSSIHEVLMVSAQRNPRGMIGRCVPRPIGERWANAALGRCGADPALTAIAAAKLWNLSRKEPTLSSDAALDRALDRLESYAEQIRRDFSGRDRSASPRRRLSPKK